MRIRTCVALIVVFAVLSGRAIAQEEADTPWESWQPPEVRMPEPNAWDIYLRAFELEEQTLARLRNEAGQEPVVGPEPGVEPDDGPAEEPAAPAEAPAAPPPGAPPPAAVPDQGIVPVRLHGSEASLEPEHLGRLVAEYDPVFSALEAAIAGQAQAPPIRSHEDIAGAVGTFAAFRQAARMFNARSTYHLRHDRPLAAALDGIACIHIAADVGGQGTLIAGLVQTACQAIGEAAVRDAIPHISGGEADVAVNALRGAMAQSPDYGEIMAGEATLGRILFIVQILPAIGDTEQLQQAVGDRELPEGGEAITPAGTWEAMTAFYESRTAEARRPYWQREELEAPDHPLLANLVSTFERAGLKFAYIDARLRVAATALAARAWLGDHGVYPPDLEALVPDYLPQVPRDPFADAPLTYIHSASDRAHPAARRESIRGDLLIYSVGPDGDDDGGADIGHDIEGNGDIALRLGAE